jgi:Tfp pilus assembly protein PilN
MRPVNLIPLEQRRGAARPGAERSPAGYIALGVLGAAVLCVLAVVVTSNQINSKTEELAEIQGDSQSQRQVADALRPYGQFADLQRARMTQIQTLAGTRFNWERPLRQLSRAIPRNVWLLNVSGSESPGVEVDSGAGGDTASIRKESQAPAFTLTGCTYSQHAVARMMTRMKNLDDVTEVHLAKSARKESSDQGSGQSTGTGAGGGDSAQEEDIQDCTGSKRVTKFDLLIVFGGGAAAAAGQAATAAPGAAAPIADANAAAQGTPPAAPAAPAGAPGQ